MRYELNIVIDRYKLHYCDSIWKIYYDDSCTLEYFNCMQLNAYVNQELCTHWAESSWTFNNSWIQSHMILKFVVLLDPLKIFYNIFVQMLRTTFTGTTTERFLHTFPMGKPQKHMLHYSPFTHVCCWRLYCHH